MLPRQRVVAEDEPQRTRELVQKPNEDRKCTGAIEALEIGVLDERHQRGRTAAHMVGVVDGIDWRLGHCARCLGSRFAVRGSTLPNTYHPPPVTTHHPPSANH